MTLSLNLVALAALASATPTPPQIVGINVLLNQPPSQLALDELGDYGTVLDVIPEINAVTLRSHVSDLHAIRSLPFVAAASTDSQCSLAGASGCVLGDFADGASQWSLDAINVTDFGGGRTVDYTGEGVYVAVIDTGLPFNWREYFPEERIATQFARGFSGGGGDHGHVSSLPQDWEHDTNVFAHGAGVTSIILGFRYLFTEPSLPSPFNGVA
jgi:hypothetical protein